MPNLQSDLQSDIHPTAGGPAPSTGDVGVAEALERVYESGQELLVRKLELLIRETAIEGRALIDRGRKLIDSALLAGVGVLVALAGWLLAVAGVLRATEGLVPRFAAEIVVGAVHCAIGAALAHRALGSRDPRQGRSQ